jgi:hypothetical protein
MRQHIRDKFIPNQRTIQLEEFGDAGYSQNRDPLSANEVVKSVVCALQFPPGLLSYCIFFSARNACESLLLTTSECPSPLLVAIFIGNMQFACFQTWNIIFEIDW